MRVRKACLSPARMRAKTLVPEEVREQRSGLSDAAPLLTVVDEPHDGLSVDQPTGRAHPLLPPLAACATARRTSTPATSRR